MNNFFEIEVYYKDNFLYIYPISLTATNTSYINYPCLKIKVSEPLSSIGNAIILASERVKNGLNQEENSNKGILEDLGEGNLTTFIKNISNCKVVKKRNSTSNDLYIRKGIKKRGGYEYSKKQSDVSDITNLEDIGRKILEALNKHQVD